MEDCGSLNGTFVNDQRVERAVRLAEGDQLRLRGSNTIFKISMMGEFEENVLRQLFALTLRDSLTHLFNRHSRRSWGRSPRARRASQRTECRSSSSVSTARSGLSARTLGTFTPARVP